MKNTGISFLSGLLESITTKHYAQKSGWHGAVSLKINGKKESKEPAR